MADGESVLSFFRRCQHDCVGGGVAQGALNSGLFKITRSKTALLLVFRLANPIYYRDRVPPPS
jgi:hypothetical protein